MQSRLLIIRAALAVESAFPLVTAVLLAFVAALD